MGLGVFGGVLGVVRGFGGCRCLGGVVGDVWGVEGVLGCYRDDVWGFGGVLGGVRGSWGVVRGFRSCIWGFFFNRGEKSNCERKKSN